MSVQLRSVRSIVVDRLASLFWHPDFYAWAAWYNTWLLIELTPKGVVDSISFSPDPHALVQGDGDARRESSQKAGQA